MKGRAQLPIYLVPSDKVTLLYITKPLILTTYTPNYQISIHVSLPPSVFKMHFPGSIVIKYKPQSQYLQPRLTSCIDMKPLNVSDSKPIQYWLNCLLHSHYHKIYLFLHFPILEFQTYVVWFSTTVMLLYLFFERWTLKFFYLQQLDLFWYTTLLRLDWKIITNLCVNIWY